MGIPPLTGGKKWDSLLASNYTLAAHYDTHSEAPTLFSRYELKRFQEQSTDAFRVFFIGSSQTYGEGAESTTDTFVSRIHQRIAAAVGPGVRIETFNFGMAGETSKGLLGQYSKQIKLHPRLIVINLAFNDPNTEALVANLRQFVTLSREHRVEVVFVTEPAPRVVGVAANHKAIRVLGKELGIVVLDLHTHMQSAEMLDFGFLWWDMIHATSLGHREIAAWLAPQLIRIIQRIRGQ